MLDVIINEKTNFFEHHNWYSQYDDVKSICIIQGKENANAKYTIAIPTYKRPKLLKEAIDSILSQQGVDFSLFNILVVDNNPERNDETEIMLREVKIPKLTYYKNERNLGAGGNVNRCVTLAGGEWIIILHSDDLLSPYFMKEMAAAIGEHPNATCIQTLKTDIAHVNEYDARDIKLRQYGKFDCYAGNVLGMPTGVAYNKKHLMKIGGIPHDKYQIYGFWTHLLCLYQGPFFCINKPLCAYRKSDANTSNDVNLQPTWICFQYWLLKNLYRKYRIPKFLYEPYLLSHVYNDTYKKIQRIWGTQFDFPEEHIEIKEFPQWRYTMSKKYLRFVERVIRKYTIKYQR